MKGESENMRVSWHEKGRGFHAAARIRNVRLHPEGGILRRMAVQISLPAYGGPERRVRPRPLKECGNVRKVVHRLKRIPGLEILADRVQCSHGSAISSISPEEIFYLLSRGIPEQTARSMIAQGFLKHALEQFSDEPLRAAVEGIILS